MLGVLCTRPKPWILTSLSFFHGAVAHHRFVASPARLVGCVVAGDQPRRHHSTACHLGGASGRAASIWHAILPSGRGRRGSMRPPAFHQGEGSWNVAWDVRPARWLHWPDSAWLLFGVCPCLSAQVELPDVITDSASGDVKIDACGTAVVTSDEDDKSNYRVTGVLADGRCLFRAIAHVACLRNGEEAPDETRQRELADELRAQVVDELLRRREETEWFIDDDFDAYVKRMQQPYVWGGEPELLMASHVLKTPISVFMVDRSSSGLVNIANYGEDYQKDEESPIRVLFHGYGHYDILDAISDQSFQKVEV